MKTASYLTAVALIFANLAPVSTAHAQGSKVTLFSGFRAIYPHKADPVTAYKAPNLDAMFFLSGMHLDTDGAPKAYHRNAALALDNLSSAGNPPSPDVLVYVHGVLAVQTASDPAPGFYISQTTLSDPAKARTDPRRYVNAEAIPYFVLPPEAVAKGAKVGDYGFVLNTSNGKSAFAVFADGGPKAQIGEGSLALARALGLPAKNAKAGGSETKNILYVVLTGYQGDQPRTLAFRGGETNEKAMVETINREGNKRFKAWGGMARLRLLELIP